MMKGGSPLRRGSNGFDEKLSAAIRRKGERERAKKMPAEHKFHLATCHVVLRLTFSNYMPERKGAWEIKCMPERGTHVTQTE